jgi:DNA-binding NarL/FixJ family response regulator
MSSASWYRGRLDLAHGSWLRRSRRIVESRDVLRSAQAVFDALGAAGWTARAERELRAAGQRPRHTQPDGWARLSAQELQIAQLAALGFSDREIGGRLYLSHRTVGSHLYRIYPKLGVRTRAQLHLALGSEQAEVTA